MLYRTHKLFHSAIRCLTSNQNSHVMFRKMTTGVRAATPVFKGALEHGDKTAIRDSRGEYSYSQVYRSSLQLSRSLVNHVKPGDRIAMLTPNNVQYVVSQWAVWMCGGVCVPLCQSHPASTLSYYIQDSGAKLLLATPDHSSTASELDVDVHIVDQTETENANKDDFPVVNDYPSTSAAMILYTSGTTGPPKGVVLTHDNLHNQVKCLLEAWEWTKEDSLLHVLPLHHTHGIVNCLLCPLTVGATVHMLPQFCAKTVWDILIEGRVNMFMAVPTIYSKLLGYYEKNDKLDTMKCADNQRLMVSGSAALAVPVLDKWADVTGHVLLERYGMTEIGMALSQPLHGERTPGFVGAPLPGVSAKIVSWNDDGSYNTILYADNSSSSVACCESGELLIKGPNVFREYHNKPEATKKEFTHDGWFKTGDTAKVENGFFRILGRTSADIIKSGGYKISALDIETVLVTHPSIQDIAVVGLDDITWGQVVAAIIVTKPDTSIDLDTLRKWCGDKMPKYWIPRELVILPEMPRNAMGKINKKELVKTLFSK